VLEQRGKDTEVVDLKGATLLPRLIEPHTHPDLSGECYSWVDVSGFTHGRVKGVEKALRQAAAAAPEGSWLFAFGLDPMLTPDLGTWDRHRLDQLAPANPVVVMLQSMHTVFVNSLALQLAGIHTDTPDPPGGGRFLRDESGELTGVAVEQPAVNVFVRFIDQSPEAWTARLREQYRRYRSEGITTIGVAGLFAPRAYLPLFEEATRTADGVRAVVYLHHAFAEGEPWQPVQADDRIAVRGVKLWYDGSPYSGTMLLNEPYLDSQLCRETLRIAPGTVGHANLEPEQAVEMLERYRERGWQVLTHAQGDRGTREILDAYENVQKGREQTDHRWRLEHCALIEAEQIVRAARLGISLSFHVNHVYYYGRQLRNSILGAERTERLMPLGTAVRSDHRISLHADSPMYPAKPLSLVRTAVTRETRDGDELGPGEALSVEQALRAVTIDAAWQLFAEDVTGSIEPGKYADFTIVDENPLTTPAGELNEIEVLGSWLEGEPLS
jgi:predicted amidohydrolase YtcJ